MPSTVEQLSPSRVKITVEVPFSDLKPSMDKAYREIAKSVNIPGFRRGKVPALVIDQRFGRGAIIQEALNDALPRFYGDAVSENKLTPLAQPEVEVTKLEDGDSIEFTAEVDVRPDFELPDFASVAVTVDAIEILDEEVDAQIELLRQRFGSRQTAERPAQESDVVTIDLVARVGGEPIEDGTAEGQEYVVGSDTMLPGLDEAVTGLSAGESATFTSTLVGGPHKDEEAEIEVTVTAVQEQELPAVDDDFAQLASDFDTLEDMRADLRSGLTRMARVEQAAAARDAVLEAVVTQVAADVPEQLRAAELEGRQDQIREQLASAGLSLEQYLAESGEADSEDAFWADVEQRSATALKAQMILDKVADEQGVSVDQEDLTAHLIRKAQQDRTTPQEIAEHLREHPHHIDEYMMEIRRGKSLAAIVESAQVTDTNGDRVELAALRADGTLAGEDNELDTESADDGELAYADEVADPHAESTDQPSDAPVEVEPASAPSDPRLAETSSVEDATASSGHDELDAR